MRRLLGRSAAIAAATALLALPGLAGAEKYKRFAPISTQGWKTVVPATWKKVQSRKYGLEQHFGRWLVVSSNRQAQLRINLSPDKGGSIKKLAHAGFNERLRRRLSDMKVIKEEVAREAGRDIHYMVMKGSMLRNNFMREYYVARITMRYNKRKTIAMVTLSMTNERVGEFMKVLQKIADGFDLVAPKPIKQRPPAVKKPAGKKA